MKKYVLYVWMLCLLLLTPSLAVSAQQPKDAIGDPDDIVRAKIGIRIASNDVIRRAKAEDNIKVGDRLRIYIQPEFDRAMIYVIYHSRQQILPFYNARHALPRKLPLILPAKEGSYTVDGESPKEELTIICSPEPLTELEEFLEAQAQDSPQAPEAWNELERSLLEQSKITLHETISRPWSIAGTVRAIDPFLMKLPIFSGKTFVIKTYEFLVEE